MTNHINIHTLHLKTVKELRAIAKHHKFKGYSRLRKTDLLDFIVIKDNSRKFINKNSPEYYDMKTVKELKAITDKYKIRFLKHTPTKEILINTIIDLKQKLSAKKAGQKRKIEIQEHLSALRGFTYKYVIGGWSYIDLDKFMNAVEPTVINLLSNNRESKVCLIATCSMTRIDPSTNEKVNSFGYFHSSTVTNLVATDVNKIYSKAKAKILESMAEFMRQGSGWKF